MISRLSGRGAVRCLAAVAFLLFAASPAWAQEEASGLVPLFGDGRLTINAGGFKPGEVVTVEVVLNLDAPRQFTATADSRGRFRLQTGLAVPPGASLKLDARGDQGTGVAVITAVPAEAPTESEPPGQVPSAPGKPPVQGPAGIPVGPNRRPDQLPRSGGPIGPEGLLVAAGGGAALAGLAGRWLARG